MKNKDLIAMLSALPLDAEVVRSIDHYNPELLPVNGATVVGGNPVESGFNYSYPDEDESQVTLIRIG